MSRFGLAGVANTAVGFAVIALLDVGLHLNPHLANAVGFAFGLVVSFALNRGFVFRNVEGVGATAPRFIVAALICFGLNQVVLTLAKQAMGDADWASLCAQLAGMTTYTVTMFAACRVWVFSAVRVTA
jgi:putative flippase GtrA